MRMADVMRTRRVALGLSQAELDERAGVGAGSIAAYEIPGVEPTHEAAMRIAEALGLSLGELTADDTTQMRWFIETALEIAVETEGVTTIGMFDNEQRTTFFLPREPSD